MVDFKSGYFNSKEDYYYTTPDTNPSVTVKSVAGTTIAVWLFIFYMKIHQGANFGQI